MYMLDTNICIYIIKKKIRKCITQIERTSGKGVIYINNYFS